MDFGASYDPLYRDLLGKAYNRTQGGNSTYLDTLHTKFSCCGTSGMQLKVDGDPTLFKPTHETLTKLPSSCCIELDANEQCNSDHIYQTPCDETTSLVVSLLIWKCLFYFAYKKGSDDLFAKLAQAERIQMII